MGPSPNSPVCTQDMVNKWWQQGCYWYLNYVNSEQVTLWRSFTSFMFETVREEVFLCQSSDECSMFESVRLLIWHVSMFLWRTSSPLSRHWAPSLSSPQAGESMASSSLAPLHRSTGIVKNPAGVFLRYKSDRLHPAHRPLSGWRRQRFWDINTWRWIWTCITQNPHSFITEII